MAFKVGHKKLGGRKKNTQNKLTVDVKAAFHNMLDIYMNPDSPVNAFSDMAEIEDPEKRLNVMVKLAEYIVPKLNRTEMEANVHSSNEVTKALVNMMKKK